MVLRDDLPDDRSRVLFDGLRIGADLLESVYPISKPDVDWKNLSRWQANRKSLEELLQLRPGAVDNLRASVSILAPTATSVITVLLGTK
jgi:hypothetical protein